MNHQNQLSVESQSDQGALPVLPEGRGNAALPQTLYSAKSTAQDAAKSCDSRSLSAWAFFAPHRHAVDDVRAGIIVQGPCDRFLLLANRESEADLD